MGMSGISALIHTAARLELDFGLETLAITCPENAPGDCTLEIAGRFLLYSIGIYNEGIHVAASLLDATASPEHLLHCPDNEQGWELGTRFITSLEKYEVRSLVRPILVGDPYYHDPATCWIIAY